MIRFGFSQKQNAWLNFALHRSMYRLVGDRPFFLPPDPDADSRVRRRAIKGMAIAIVDHDRALAKEESAT